MNDELKPYRITAYTEWEVLDVEAKCVGDEHAREKARRYGSLKHFNVALMHAPIYTMIWGQTAG